ncbi:MULTISPECIES: hypothetical protein [unclassified Cellulophaga]|uniref:hypothetical protein n=1 Tax=unclassified Cellulophaga TaxID=2634405 RepID=UPI0026E2722C|nr:MULTISPECIES: hypothetical protein [unclassified Cellulophaga]MDO6490079.1 hypothetical protein [Cellulophaga sp. 2_MG-2023]MDO6494727.1 hypothetical protein [Cellulophaga sp. 3_MG-2023]
MKNRKKHWLWNIVIVLTLMVVVIAFMAHYKNWIKIENNQFKILSGVYYKTINFTDVNTVEMVDKIPSLERINGFSVSETEKGVFRDSIYNTDVYIFVDKLSRQKIKVTYKDSLQLFFNVSDSLETEKMYTMFSHKIDSLSRK